MSELRRSSRADRRKRIDQDRDDERRKGPASELTAYSQMRNAELVIFVQQPLTAQNCTAARHILTSHLRRNPELPAVFDLQKCSYIETPGLSLLFDLKRELEGHGRSFLLQNPSRAVLRMLNITRMARIFPVRMTTSDHELIPTARSGAAPEGSLLSPSGDATADFTPPAQPLPQAEPEAGPSPEEPE